MVSQKNIYKNNISSIPSTSHSENCTGNSFPTLDGKYIIQTVSQDVLLSNEFDVRIYEDYDDPVVPSKPVNLKVSTTQILKEEGTMGLINHSRDNCHVSNSSIRSNDYDVPIIPPKPFIENNMCMVTTSIPDQLRITAKQRFRNNTTLTETL